MPRAFTDAERETIAARLRHAASDAMHHGGLRRMSIDRLTRAAGISKGAFYDFFPSKEALAVAVLKEAEARLRQELDEAAAGPDPLHAVLQLLMTAVVDHPQLALLREPDDLVWLRRGLPDEAFVEARADDDAWFAGLHQRLVDRGALRPGAPVDAFQALPGAALALAQQPDLLGDGAGTLRREIIDALVVQWGT